MTPRQAGPAQGAEFNAIHHSPGSKGGVFLFQLHIHSVPQHTIICSTHFAHCVGAETLYTRGVLLFFGSPLPLAVLQWRHLILVIHVNKDLHRYHTV